MEIRDATREHLEQVAAIYAEAVATPATFDLEPLPIAAWQRVLAEGDPAAGRFLLVAVEGGDVVGYALTARFMARPAYDITRITSVYLTSAQRGRGLGTALYHELLGRLDASHARLAVAGITLPNPASVRLHESCGYTPVGTFEGVGFKMGRAWDVRWYQRPV